MKKWIAILTLGLTFIFESHALAYVVKAGDTMSKIASENNLSLQELSTLNPQIEDLDVIYIGQTVHVTSNAEADVAPASEEKQVQVNAKKQTISPSHSHSLSKSEIDLLARLVRAEAQTEPYEGKVAVACVVLNRLESPKYPDTIKEVIYQKRQFQPVSNGQINKPADEDSVRAVHEALSTKRDLADDSLFFYNPEIATSRWLDSRTTTLVIGGHVFKK